MATTRDTDDDQMFLRPAPGRLVRRPYSMQPLPEEGALVRGDRFYWHRMIRAGDVVVVERPRKEETK